MTLYTVHLYREMRLTFDCIEADSATAAAVIARDKPTDAADQIDDCEGETLSALVDVDGDEEYEHSCVIDFDQEKQRKAAPQLLDALKWITRCPTIRGPVGTTAYIVSDERMAEARRAVGVATAACITGEPSAQRLRTCLEALLPYAENEAFSLEKLKDSPQAEAEAERAWRVVESARTLVVDVKPTETARRLAAGNDRPPRFEIERDRLENPDRAHVLVDGKFDVAIIRTDEGIVVDVYPKDGMETVASTYALDSDLAEGA